MSDRVTFLLVVGVLLLVVALIHGVFKYRRLVRQPGAVGREISDLSLAVWKQARKIVILLIGGSVVLVGVALIFLPGPGSLVIPLGLTILAVEFAWARRWLRHLRVTLHLSAKRSRRWWRRTRATADS